MFKSISVRILKKDTNRCGDLFGRPLAGLFAWFGLTMALAASMPARTLATNAVYDVSRDFSTVANPSGVWSYGWKSNVTGNFTLLTNPQAGFLDGAGPIIIWDLDYNQLPHVMKNTSANTGTSGGGAGMFPPGTVWFYPGFDGWPQNFGAIRFTVPQSGAGKYLLESAVRTYLDGAASRDADYHVVVNGVELFKKFLSPNSATGYTNILDLAVGDTVDFLVGRGADGIEYSGGQYGGLKIQAALSQVPEPCIPYAATAAATLVNGFVVGINIIDGGCGYTNVPSVRITGGGGDGAMATATVSNGVVTRITVTSAGFGYTSIPRVVISSPPFMPWLEVAVSKVRVTQHVMLGKNYVLEASVDLKNWSQVAGPFTAEEEIVDQEFAVDQTGRFFRLREVP